MGNFRRRRLGAMMGTMMGQSPQVKKTSLNDVKELTRNMHHECLERLLYHSLTLLIGSFDLCATCRKNMVNP